MRRRGRIWRLGWLWEIAASSESSANHWTLPRMVTLAIKRQPSRKRNDTSAKNSFAHPRDVLHKHVVASSALMLIPGFMRNFKPQLDLSHLEFIYGSGLCIQRTIQSICILFLSNKWDFLNKLHNLF